MLQNKHKIRVKGRTNDFSYIILFFFNTNIRDTFDWYHYSEDIQQDKQCWAVTKKVTNITVILLLSPKK